MNLLNKKRVYSFTPKDTSLLSVFEKYLDDRLSVLSRYKNTMVLTFAIGIVGALYSYNYATTKKEAKASDVSVISKINFPLFKKTEYLGINDVNILVRGNSMFIDTDGDTVPDVVVSKGIFGGIDDILSKSSDAEFYIMVDKKTIKEYLAKQVK